MIVPMKRLTLIGLKGDEAALLSALQAMEAVQILPPEEGRESERVAQLESRVQRLNSAQLAQTQAQLNYSQAIFDYLTAKAEYDRIVGKEK